MKQIKLKKLNKIKWCPDCEQMVEIDMIDRDGFCTICRVQVYTIDCRENRLKAETKEDLK